MDTTLTTIPKVIATTVETPTQSVFGQLRLYNTKANSTKLTMVVQVQKVTQIQTPSTWISL